MRKKIYTRWRLTPLCLVLCGILLNGYGCKKFIEVDVPVNSVNAGTVYLNDDQAASVLTGIYTKFNGIANVDGFPAMLSMSVFGGLSADELTLFVNNDIGLAALYTNALTNEVSKDLWTGDGTGMYSLIFYANSAMEGIASSAGLNKSISNQLMGEAMFVRAFEYFYLVNLYGPVPLALSTDVEVNRLLRRSTVEEVYKQIVKDLEAAIPLLNDNYLSADAKTVTVNRLRPCKAAARALLARVYVYRGEHAKAAELSTLVINNAQYAITDSLNNAFAKNSTEAIWQIQPVGASPGTTANTPEGYVYILQPTGPAAASPVYLSDFLLNSFEAGDKRRFGRRWIDSVKVGASTYFYPLKYKVGRINAANSEYSMVLRLAEQYLIRAEARAQLGDIDGAKADLNKIRNRAGLINTSANSTATLLTAIQQERRVELFTEWGHRWFDLKRTNMVDEVMNIVTPQKGGVWDSRWQWYPIRLTELQRNPNMKQNDGY